MRLRTARFLNGHVSISRIAVNAVFALGMLLVACAAEGQQTPSATAIVSPEATTEAAPLPTATATQAASVHFDGQNAFSYLEAQMAFGPRWPGSEGHVKAGDYIVAELEKLGWQVEEQRFPYQGLEGRNIIGRTNSGRGGVIILGAHYDTRKVANRSPDATAPAPGAVDGASGVAVLLELARTLNLGDVEHEIWLAFFDLEDNGSGGMPGFDWIVGSTYMAQNLAVTPEAMVLVDMVGDADQQLYYEVNSDTELQAQLWAIAADLGYGQRFIPQLNHALIDDHLPFAQAGIPAVDIIDFDYPYWHTVDDTADKASPDSLESVGRTLQMWLEESSSE
jgi:glutaminyl-peptide cyclotransferase